MHLRAALTITFACFAAVAVARAADCKSTVSGDLRIPCLSDVSHAEWQVDETVYRLIREKAIPEMIVVGVDHAGMKRAYEFLPYKDSFNPDMEAKHTESAWAGRLPDALKFLFGDWKPEPEVPNAGNK